MKSIKNIFKKEKKSKSKSSSSQDQDESSDLSVDVPVMEISESGEAERVGAIEPILVKSFDLNSVVDVQEIATELRDGNIVIINISPLMDEDPEELKRAIDQLKGIADDVGGDVGRLSESRIITTPELVRIEFRREEE